MEPPPSLVCSLASTSCSSTRGKSKSPVFQDLPLIDRNTRLAVIELKNSDKQVVNELVYRFCRIITREPDTSRQVLILDLTGSTNPIRLATVLKRDVRRMRSIGICRGCKINSTFVTVNTHLKNPANRSLKLLAVYHDDYFIIKTLGLLKTFMDSTNCQILFIVPKLDAREYEVLKLNSVFQILRCNFLVARQNIGQAPSDQDQESYQSYLNQICFQRSYDNKTLPERVEGELTELGLYFHRDTVGNNMPGAKKIKSEGGNGGVGKGEDR